MYEIKTTGEKIKSFMEAVNIAKTIDSEVFEVETGLRRWAPAPESYGKAHAPILRTLQRLCCARVGKVI